VDQSAPPNAQPSLGVAKRRSRTVVVLVERSFVASGTTGAGMPRHALPSYRTTDVQMDVLHGAVPRRYVTPRVVVDDTGVNPRGTGPPRGSAAVVWVLATGRAGAAVADVTAAAVIPPATARTAITAVSTRRGLDSSGCIGTSPVRVPGRRGRVSSHL
jgi:hypothetical protein